MARSKEKRGRGRPSVLLVGSRPRLPQGPPSRRDKRTQGAKSYKGKKGRAAEDIEAESKVEAEAADLDGDSSRASKQGRHQSDDKNRQPDRGAKGKNSTARRSAKELGIEWIGDKCPDDRPHYLIDRHTFDGGSLFRCNNCQKHVWLPTFIKDASELEQLIKQYGTNTGYCKYLDKNRNAKVMVAKLQDLWYARWVVTDREEFAKLVIKVMEDKEYDRPRAS